MVEHPIAPVYDNNSKILILGSFPSVKSREEMFFYGHPQNRFWKVLAGVFAERIPEGIQEKRSFLLKHKIALWDVIASCDIEGSSDSSIKNVVPNNLNTILEQSNIEKIFVNGKTAYKYYNTYLRDTIKIEAICLPSTSPANAAWNFEKLICAWSAVKK